MKSTRTSGCHIYTLLTSILHACLFLKSCSGAAYAVVSGFFGVRYTSNCLLSISRVLLSKPESAGVFTLEREEVHSFESTVESHVTIMWIVPEHQPSGTFRIAYYADHVTEGGLRFPFEGYSSQFQIVNEWVYNEASWSAFNRFFVADSFRAGALNARYDACL